MDDALQTFVVESRELLEQMEAALLQVEQMPDDKDTINAIFRAAHTIKGSAGLFGIDHIVKFTHAAESVLGRVREAELKISSELVALLLSVRDQLGALIEHVAEGREPDASVHEASETLATKLRAYLGETKPSAPVPLKPEADAASHASTESGERELVDGANSDNWHISLRFDSGVLRNGMDPLAFIRYLTTFGKIARMATLTDAVPTLADMDPEACYLGFEIAFHTDADKEQIASAFEFVRDDAQIGILPPHSRISEYLRLIHELPEEDLLLGEILVRCGTLTEKELEQGLRRQSEAGATGEASKVPIGAVLVGDKVVHPPVVEAALAKQQQVRQQRAAEASSIRVNASKLDEHINLIGELIIASAGTSLIAQSANMSDLTEAAARLSRLVEEIRDSALSLRMVEIGATFTKFQRVVRDISAELGKDIRLEISGAETELDKTVIEKIGDPLTHLVRNSLDHGIESTERRLAAGKPPYGTIRLNAFHDSGSIVIEVGDDGGGLNRERILAKAIERGLVKADQVLSDEEIHNLIFEPGFSTAEQVNNLSGRGVGMDVVRRNIIALRGSVDIESHEGVGTTIRIRLPLTLAIIDGFLVGVGGSSFVVPLDMVVECVELTPEETRAANGRDHLNLRGEVLPFIRLTDLFGIAEAEFDSGESLAAKRGNGGRLTVNGITLTPEGEAALAADPELAFILNPVRRQNVVVVEYAGRRAGLVVDQLMGEFQTVIRPLGVVFGGLQGLSGFTILGNGRVALILDVPGLVRRVAGREVRRAISGTPSVPSALGARAATSRETAWRNALNDQGEQS
jgi:two-component system chemotaxis sensor kinase CheA